MPSRFNCLMSSPTCAVSWGPSAAVGSSMVTKGAKVLVIGAIDGTTLSDILQKAADAGVKVIAYDRLIRDSGNVDYYATFDNFQVGVLQATSLVEGLKLDSATEPKNIELFGGSPDDNNAFFFYDGAMSVLQPLIDSGKLVVKSGQMGMVLKRCRDVVNGGYDRGLVALCRLLQSTASR